MKHGVKQRKLGREKAQRDALLASLAVSLVKEEKIKTTEAKAKELRPYVEKLVTRGKNASTHSRRVLASTLNNNKVIVKKIVDDLAKRYEKRPGGYTRVVKLAPRKSDGAKMAFIEFVK